MTICLVSDYLIFTCNNCNAPPGGQILYPCLSLLASLSPAGRFINYGGQSATSLPPTAASLKPIFQPEWLSPMACNFTIGAKPQQNGWGTMSYHLAFSLHDLPKDYLKNLQTLRTPPPPLANAAHLLQWIIGWISVSQGKHVFGRSEWFRTIPHGLEPEDCAGPSHRSTCTCINWAIQDCMAPYRAVLMVGPEIKQYTSARRFTSIRLPATCSNDSPEFSHV